MRASARYTAAIIAAIALGSMSPAAAQIMDAEFDAQWGLAAIGAQYALERGITGAGIGVVVVDTAFQTTHPEFNIPTDRVGSFQYNPNGDAEGEHGTHVAGIIGAGRNGFGMEGVAPGVILSSMTVLNAAGGDSADDAQFAQGYRDAIAAGLRIFNNSIWYSGTQITNFTRAGAIAQIGPLSVAALQEAVDAGASLVFITGNASDDNPDVLGGLPYLVPELVPGWITVTSVDRNIERSTFANACGVGMYFCMAAPGTDIYSTVPVSTYDTMSGTSMAAPHVTGAVALARQMFPNASGAALVSLVLRTATDIGDPGVDDIFGWGFLNVGNLVSTADSATGSVFTNAAFGRFAAVDTVVTTLWDRSAQRIMNAAAGGSGPVAVAQAQSAYQPPMALGGPGTGSAAYIDAPALYARGPAVWAQGLLAHASIDASANAAKASVDTGGAVGGYELVDEGPWHGGFAIAFTQSDLGGVDDGSAQGWHGFGYATWQENNWFVDGIVGGNWFDNSYRRVNILGAAGTVLAGQGLAGSSSNDTYGFSSRLTAGHLYEMGHYALLPYAYASWLYQRSGGIDETGADIFSLVGNANTLDQVEGGIGMRAQLGGRAWHAFSILPSVDVAYGRLGGDVAFPVGLELLGTPIAAEATDVGRDVFRIGAQLNVVRFDAMVSGYLGYDGRFQDQAQNNTFSGGVLVRF
jgi:subtilase-type serine protease